MENDIPKIDLPMLKNTPATRLGNRKTLGERHWTAEFIR